MKIVLIVFALYLLLPVYGYIRDVIRRNRPLTLAEVMARNESRKKEAELTEVQKKMDEENRRIALEQKNREALERRMNQLLYGKDYDDLPF